LASARGGKTQESIETLAQEKGAARMEAGSTPAATRRIERFSPMDTGLIGSA